MDGYYSPEKIYEDLRRKIADKHETVFSDGEGGILNTIKKAAVTVDVSHQIEPVKFELPKIDYNKPTEPDRNNLHFKDLACFNDEDFVAVAYKTILNREPDPDGKAYFLGNLRSGKFNKAEVVGRVRYSAEGRKQRQRVRGILRPFLFAALGKVPILGYLLTTFVNIFQLPDLKRRIAMLETRSIQKEKVFHSHLNNLSTSLEAVISRTASCDSLSNVTEELQRAVNSNVSVEQLELLINSLKSAFKSKADQIDLEHTQSKVGFLESLIETKAGQVYLEQLQSLVREIENLVKAKAEQSELEQLHVLVSEVDRVVKAKAEQSELEQLHVLVSEVDRVVKAKAEQSELEQLQGLVSEVDRVVKAKAEQSELEQVQGLLTIMEADLQNKATAAEFDQLDTSVKDLKYNVLDQQRRLALLLEEARKRLPEQISQEQITTMLTEEEHLLDALYVSFEDRFRGTRQDIKDRASIYLPFVEEAKAGTAKYPILDLGCGRGEWLEILKEEKLNARGIDTNRVMLNQCRELELEVTEADAITYLRELKSASIGAITAIHFIEHIGFKNIITLLDESIRILKPGGVIILETPNPENLIVGACNFYYDPSHLNPLPPEPMSFIVEARGFSKVEIMRMHPRAEDKKKLNNISSELSNIIGGAQDYAVIGYKI